ncbi:MAG: ABC transporter permease [candidate division KSB1 bacterium]|nr:ABC transporter permease [candidate division KSB1 bacterium]
MKTNRLFKIAYIGLGRNKLRTFLMMIGIVIGITALTLIVSAGLGAQKRVMDRVKKFGLHSMMVFAGGGRERGQPVGEGPTTTLTLRDAKAIKREVNGIAEVAPFSRKGNAEIKYLDQSTTAAVFGITPSWAYVWDWDVQSGDFISQTDMDHLNRVCLVGPTVQKELFGDTNPVGQHLRIGNVQFEVKGVMQPKGTSPGGGDMDNRINIPLTTFMRRVANVDYTFGIKILLTSAGEMDQAAENITAMLRERHVISPGMPDDFRIVTPDEVTEFAGKVAGTLNIFLALVAGIALISGGVVVANIMLISVNERKKEIGLRRAVGARRKDIKLQFLVEAAVVTSAGGVLGIILGGIGARILQIITGMPVLLSWEAIVLGVVCSGLVGIIAGMQPASRASRLQPVESLRS